MRHNWEALRKIVAEEVTAFRESIECDDDDSLELFKGIPSLQKIITDLTWCRFIVFELTKTVMTVNSPGVDFSELI